ncbi:MAG: hypothetical protein KDA72_12895 [Planctomycetales bacterium]|nr:hypothetical protein [Planctomycetales bacterium]
MLPEKLRQFTPLRTGKEMPVTAAHFFGLVADPGVNHPMINSSSYGQ